MAKRPEYQQQHDIKPGTIVPWHHALTPDEVAERVTFTGNTQHKTYPSPAGPPALKWHKAKCSNFGQNWNRLQDVLRAAIRAEITDEFDGDFPVRAWAYINNVLHEARCHNRELGEYHGFPVIDSSQYPQPVAQLENAPNVNIPTIN